MRSVETKLARFAPPRWALHRQQWIRTVCKAVALDPVEHTAAVEAIAALAVGDARPLAIELWAREVLHGTA